MGYGVQRPDDRLRCSQRRRCGARGLGARLGTLLVLLCILVLPAAAATRWSTHADTVFRHYAEEQGLPPPPVTALAQDGDGFLWLGTQNGLARFDGYRFKHFIPEPGNPAALPVSYVYTLHSDTRGRIWVGTLSGGLARVDGDRFVVYSPERGNLRGVEVRAIIDDGAGGLWVVTENGLDHLNAADARVALAPGMAASEPDDIRVLLRDRNGVLWLGTRHGLFRLDGASGRFVAVDLKRAGGAPPSVSALFEDGDGRLWIGTSQEGVYLLDAARTGPATMVQATGATGDLLARARVHEIVDAGGGQLWLGTYGQGIFVVDAAGKVIRRLHHDAALDGSLRHDDIWALLRDRSGSMWVGDAYALEQMADGDGSVLTLLGGVHAEEGGLSSTDVSAIQATADGRVWFGYGNGMVDIVDPLRGRVARLEPDPSRPESALPKVYIRGFAIAGGMMYIGTNRGLYRSDLEGRGLERVTVPGKDPVAMVDGLCAEGGVLWVGGYGDGAYALAVDGTAAPAIRHVAAEALTNARISDIVRGRGDDLWLSTYNGLNRLDLRSGKLQRIFPDPSRVDALTPGVIGSLLMDRRGRLWVGMIGGGIAVMVADGDAPRFRRIGVPDGLPNGTVDTLLEGPKGRIWASTDSGLAVIDPATFAVRALQRAEGVAIRTYWAGSGTVTPAGEIVFGGSGGATVVDPERLNAWNYMPPIVVTDLKVGEREVAWRTGTTIRVPAAANALSVEFSALDYTEPGKNRYAYRLEGFDDDWIATDATRRLATYANLPPGDYILRLRGSNRSGAWNPRTLDLSVVVEAAWYQTFAFRLLVGLAVVLGIIVLIELRTAYLRRRQQELEQRIERERSSVRQLEQAERVQRALFDIAELTTSSIERTVMLQRIHRIVSGLMYAENFYIALHDGERKTLRYVYFADTRDPWDHDPDREIPEQELAGSATLSLIRLGEPVRGSSIELRDKLGLARSEGSGPEAEAWLGVPMVAAGEVRGVLVVQSYDKTIRYTEADQDLLLFVAGHILTALTRRQAKEELEHQVLTRTRELAQANADLTSEIAEREAGERLQSVLFRIAELSSAGGSVAEFLQAAHAEIGKLLYAQNFYVALLVDGDTAIEFPYAVDERDTGVIFAKDKLGHGLTEYVLRTGQPLLAYPDTIQALVAAGEVARAGTPSACWLGVPLALNDRIAGVLVVQSYTPSVVYSLRDQELLTFVSLHLATALQRRQAQESLQLAYADLQRHMEELRRTQSELIENEKMASLGRLVAGVAHEINTPLGIGVTAATHLEELFGDIEAGCGDPPPPQLQAVLNDARRCVQLVLSNLNKADRLVKSFKQVAVDQSNEQQRRIHLKSYLDDVLASLGPRLKRTPHRVVVECPPELEIETLPGALYQIVANMVINALLHAFDEEHAGTIRIRVQRAGDGVELRFADDGKGMSEDVRHSVFEPFFTTRRGSGGTGLGLHLVYNLVTQLLHGSIECSSAPGRGTEFIIQLPPMVVK